MGHITLILGGARSGKSTYAEKIALDVPRDGGLRRRGDGKANRAAPRAPPRLVGDVGGRSARTARRSRAHGRPDAHGLPHELMDCLTMWLTRLFLASPASEEGGEAEWLAEEAKITALARGLFESVKPDASLVVVSNEVGLGLVPPYRMGRRSRSRGLPALGQGRRAARPVKIPLFSSFHGGGSNRRFQR